MASAARTYQSQFPIARRIVRVILMQHDRNFDPKLTRPA